MFATMSRRTAPLLVIILLAGLLASCRHTINLREVCNDGRSLSYQGSPVGCIYDADAAYGRVDDLCASGSGHTAYESELFGTPVSGDLGGGRLGCLVCIHRGFTAANDAIRPGGLYPEGFAPGIGCLGYFRFEPLPR